VKTVDAVILRRWLDEGSATLVDVREPAEYRAQHIAEAHPIPSGKIDARQLPGGSRIVMHCLKGGRHTPLLSAVAILIRRVLSIRRFQSCAFGSVDGKAEASIGESATKRSLSR
jgi:hypothetical protein